MSKSKAAAEHRKLKKLLLQVGPACDGSLSEVFQKCGKPSCRCHKGKRYRHGPYYLWTRKVDGKTVTRKVLAAEAGQCREWIANNHRLNEIIRRMRALTWEAPLSNE